MDGGASEPLQSITLSSFTRALLKNLAAIKPKPQSDSDKLSVSQTATFFALLYERIRTAVEYKDAHLIRRAAIERILKRRLALNPEGEGEGENVLRELLWARYFPQESLTEADSDGVQKIIDTYLAFKKKIRLNGYLSQFLLDLLTCEIEEYLSPVESQENALFTYYIFQTIKNKVKIEGVTPEQQDAYFYVALEKAFNKSDEPYLRYRLFALSYKPLTAMDAKEHEALAKKFPEITKKLDSLISHPASDRTHRFIRSQIPPFRISFSLWEKNHDQTESILKDSAKLKTAVEKICHEKYAVSRDRLKNLAIRAIIYIFLTKMIFALALEYPLSRFFYGEVNLFAITVNTLFPPILMFLIIAATRIPGAENTRRLYARIVNIIDANQEYESTVAFVGRRARVRRPSLIFAFTIVYSLTFFITFLLLSLFLSLFRFNFISQLVFVFFISLISFFGYRIRGVAKEYELKEKEGFFSPFVDFFSIPILSVGKVLSSGIAKLNFFTVIFDFFIEAPFKSIIEVVEEWIKFVRERRDEIV